jgi:hypothetical protein
MLSAGDVAPKGARDATLILLRETQRCTDSMNSMNSMNSMKPQGNVCQ